MNIKITNKIEDKINEYQEQTGTTKKWLCDKMGISPSRLYQIFKTENMTLEIYIKFSILLNCKIEDLFEYEVIEHN